MFRCFYVEYIFLQVTSEDTIRNLKGENDIHIQKEVT